MEQEKMIDLFKVGENNEKILVFTGVREKCMNYIGGVAHKENYNIYRRYEVDGWYYYDCGPQTFCAQTILEARPH